MSNVIYPGSFDPITNGHLDIIKRGVQMFGHVTVLVLNNSQKNLLFSLSERVSIINRVLEEYNIEGVNVDTNDGLLIDYARKMGSTVVIRGLRAITDFEYELQLAQVNHVQYPKLETVFLTTSLNYSYLSSSIVREFALYDGDISKFVPECIIPTVYEKCKLKKETVNAKPD